MKIIGISGFGRTGKDTIVYHLAHYGYRRLAFADGVREMAWELDPLLILRDGGQVSYRQAISSGVSDDLLKRETNLRRHLVRIGAGARTVISPTVWIDRVHRIILDDPGQPWAISDVRYENEVEMIHSLGGVVWGVTRPGTGPANDEEARSFETVRPDLVIENDGTLADLSAKVDELIRGDQE